MAEIKVTLPAPHRAQQKILDRASRYNVVAMGEKGGKTSLGIEALLAGPKGALRGYPVAWFSATTSDLIEDKRRILRLVEPAIKRRVTSKRVEPAPGGVIDFYAIAQVDEFFAPSAHNALDQPTPRAPPAPPPQNG